MARVLPYHSTSADDPKVYHDHDDCPAGQQIDRKNIKLGTGNRERCGHCKNMG